MAGFAYARLRNFGSWGIDGNWVPVLKKSYPDVVLLDGDLSHPPKLITNTFFHCIAVGVRVFQFQNSAMNIVF